MSSGRSSFIGFVLLSLAAVGRATPVSAQNEIAAGVAVASGVAIMAVGVYDIAAAPRSARRTNAQLALAPWLDAREGRYGMAVSIPLATSRQPPRLPATSREPLQQRPPKSPSSAFLWSAGATLIPITVGLASATAGGWNDNHGTLAAGITGMSLGWLVGPSAGHWYAGQHGRGWLTTGVRVALYGVGILALSAMTFD